MLLWKILGRKAHREFVNHAKDTLAGSTLWTNHPSESKMKKGAGASPLFKLTPQKPNPSRGSGPATPGSQSHVLAVERAIVVPAVDVSPQALQPIDLQAFTLGPHKKFSRQSIKFYKISQSGT